MDSEKQIPNIENKKSEPKIKEGADFVFEQNPEILTIGNREQYSEYLDNIFPESKIRNISFHDSDEEKTEGFVKNDSCVFTTGDDNWWQKGKYKYPLLINVLSPKIINTGINSDIARDFFSDSINNNYDTLITVGSGNIDKGVYVLRNSEQIHILGNKQDIENFKKFIEEKNKNQDEKYLVK